MRNVRLGIEYDGSRYHGWQYQPNAPTIQACIEQAISTVTGERVRIIGAGRTDAGVHARGQVANFFTRSRLDAEALQRAINTRLPEDIVITDAADVPEEFHARKDALRKRYEYWVWNRRTPSAFHYRYCWHVRSPLDLQRMREAARHFLGAHDFSSFCASDGGHRGSAVRTVFRFDIERFADGKIRFGVEADGFLKSMVRAMVGTVVEIGRGKRHGEDIPSILQARDRRVAGVTAPPHALFLEWVSYRTSAGARDNDAGERIHPAIDVSSHL